MTERHRILLDLIRRQEQFKLRVRRPLDPKVMKYIEEGKPFAAADQGGVLCFLCGKHFEVAGTHFSRRHGLPVFRGIPREERLVLYGFPQGVRLASLAYRNGHVENGNRQAWRLEAYRSLRPNLRGRKSLAPRSDKQLDAIARLGIMRRVRSLRYVKCLQCQKVFSLHAGDLHKGRTKFCSRICAAIALSRQIKTQCQFCQKIFTIKPSKLNYGRGKYCSHECADRARSHPRPEWRDPEKRINLKCQNCGNLFTIFICKLRFGRGKFCSKHCARKALWAGKKETRRAGEGEMSIEHPTDELGLERDGVSRSGNSTRSAGLSRLVE